jgi:hypothetical protein
MSIATFNMSDYSCHQNSLGRRGFDHSTSNCVAHTAKFVSMIQLCRTSAIFNSFWIFSFVVVVVVGVVVVETQLELSPYVNDIRVTAVDSLC